MKSAHAHASYGCGRGSSPDQPCMSSRAPEPCDPVRTNNHPCHRVRCMVSLVQIVSCLHVNVTGSCIHLLANVRRRRRQPVYGLAVVFVMLEPATGHLPPLANLNRGSRCALVRETLYPGQHPLSSGKDGTENLPLSTGAVLRSRTSLRSYTLNRIESAAPLASR
jgi:hypothetical protein